MVVLEQDLWLNVLEIKDMDWTAFRDSLLTPTSLFGPAVHGFVECFTAVQKSSQAVHQFLPKRSSSAAVSSHQQAPLTQPAKPAPLPAQPQSKPEPELQQRSKPTNCYPIPKCQGPQSHLDMSGEKRRGFPLSPPSLDHP